VDLSDPEKKAQLTFGPTSDIQPALSPDGGTIYFASDRNENGVFNIHSLDLATAEVRQYTDVVGGCFSPVEMAERGGDRNLVFTAFYEGTFRLYRMPLKDPEQTIPAEQRFAEPIEAEPFEPPLSLRVDEPQKSDYKLKWDIEAPSVGVGVTDDGTFLSNASIGFSDLLGNHRIQILASTAISSCARPPAGTSTAIRSTGSPASAGSSSTPSAATIGSRRRWVFWRIRRICWSVSICSGTRIS
jgi:hypothetical protein